MLAVRTSGFNCKYLIICILDIMGPDEYNYPVNNNVYTNIAAGYAMHFAEYNKNHRNLHFVITQLIF